MMKVLFSGMFLILFMATGCLKDKSSGECPFAVQNFPVPQTEANDLQAFVALNSAYSGATKDSAGFYYIIQSQGTVATPTSLCNNVTVSYTGKLTNGTIFDQSTGTGATFTIGQLIEGWRRGLPMINEGGKITLILPPTLAYGNNEVKDPQTGEVKIPASSILIFEIELKKVL